MKSKSTVLTFVVALLGLFATSFMSKTVKQTKDDQLERLHQSVEVALGDGHAICT